MSQLENGLRENISNHIQKFVKENDITYRQFAMDTNITYTKVSAYVHMTTTPSLTTLLKMCEYMNISAGEMMGLEENDPVETALNSLEETLTSLKLLGGKK